MRTFGASFGAAGEALRRDVRYQLDSFYIDIADNITSAMKRASVTKADLAVRMGVSPARVTNLLRGYNPNLELKTIVQVAVALDVDPRDLCARRKTVEMMSRPLQSVQKPEYAEARITEADNGQAAAA